MDSKIQSLPPLKRFRLLHQQHEESDEFTSSQLPAKKRKESRNIPQIPILAISSLLPAKKRVWALPPDLDLNLEHNQQEEGAIPEEDDGIVCAVCGSTDGDPSDPIVLCDGCELMVHASCYGNPLIQGVPEGDWFCARCLSSCHNSECCRLCPVAGGAMKPTKDGRWAHLVCALYVPEVFFKDPVGRDGIDCSELPVDGYKEACYVCSAPASDGCAIQCSEPNCKLAFHVTCGLTQGLCIEYTQGRRKTSKAIVHGFCQEHTQLWNKQQQTGKFKIVARDECK
ncbi:hypothetical protein V2J09_006281 [Rumex salicifolius]